jgi:hypothetical protein
MKIKFNDGRCFVMYDNQGNLALKKQRVGIWPGHKARPQVKPSAVPLRRIAVTETPASATQAAAQAQAIRRFLARQRLKTMAGIVAMVVFTSVLFGGILMRQATILEMNFANLKMERSIAAVSQNCGQISEELAQKTNLDLIRHEAVERLGLQDPAQKQVVSVMIPDSDRVVYAGGATATDSDEAYLAAVFKNIEGFFKTVSLPGQDQ